tara:strand:- start:27 stop:311 length:285 start_codon:yes stop_codon:yes gene_type:complete
MITDFKNKTPFLLGLLFLAFVTAHEVEHISEAFEVQDDGFELSCDYCEETQSQDLVNSKTNITFIDFDIEDSELVSLTDQSLSKNYHQRAPPKI